MFAQLTHKGKISKLFSVLNLSGEFNQLEVDEKSSPLLTMNTYKGLYLTRRLVYGVKTVDKILAGLENVMCFIDDILVTGNTERGHLKTLEDVLQRLDKNNVRLSKTKCRV